MTSGRRIVFRPRRADETVPSAVVEMNGLNVLDSRAIFISMLNLYLSSVNRYNSQNASDANYYFTTSAELFYYSKIYNN